MNKRKTFVIPVLPLICLFLLSWGVTGHRTIGKIAENHLSAKAKAAVQELLGDQSLADVSTWADEVRSQPEYKRTAPWHFLNLPLGLSYMEFEQQVKGMTGENVYSALQTNEQVLLDKGTTRTQKTEALKFIVHFVGDLHQPMHISRAEDKGGNTIQLNYEGKGVNLHSLWDTYLLEHQGLSYEQLAEKYDRVSARQIKQWQSDPLIKWMWESYEISSQLYAEVDRMNSRSIDEAYYQAHIATIGERIQKAGIRLAGMLNELFKNGLVADAPADTAKPVPADTTKAADNKSTTVCEKVYSTRLMDRSQMVFLNLGGE
ncbi:MAG TPA: S1/P1 nuclease [Puia sp.]|nr:S1/P1 nuclease [Puia sp.]